MMVNERRERLKDIEMERRSVCPGVRSTALPKRKLKCLSFRLLHSHFSFSSSSAPVLILVSNTQRRASTVERRSLNKPQIAFVIFWISCCASSHQPLPFPRVL